jgi:hypothetical protein
MYRSKGVWERSHEINTSHIENLSNQNGIEGHHVSLRNIPQLLTTFIGYAISISVSKHGRPIKSIIPEKGLHHGQKFELILLPPIQRHLVGNKIVHYVM